MRKSIVLLGLLAFLQVKAQETRGVCGMSAADQKQFEQRLISNLEAAENGGADSRDIKYIPVYFHLVADASGNGRCKIFKVLDQLCALNAAYEPVGFRFYLSAHPTYGLFDKTINNDNVYSTQDNSFLMNAKRHQNALNYYITDLAASGSGGPGTVLAYYSPSNDWIVSRRDQINGLASNSTIPHETGHFFSLLHPFYGWESSSGFGPSYPTWPVAPVIAPDGVPTERQDGSNCSTAADRICDTGPDYKFAFLQAGCTPYTGGAEDPMGVLVDPKEDNMMSYFDQCQGYNFTPMQITAMQADRNNSSRNFLNNSYSPQATSIDTPSDIQVAPNNNVTTQFYNAVTLQWNAVTGATHYLIEVDDIPTFSTTNAREYVQTGTSLLLTDLAANHTYYWRIRPFNLYATCATASLSRKFKTSTALTETVEIPGLDAWQVSPNPASGDQVVVNVNAKEDFQASVRLVDAAGRTVQEIPAYKFMAGANAVELPLAGLANGFYVVQLSNGQSRDLRKLVVAR